jgi:hypothetical protein
MRIENRRASDEPNLVASFKTAVMSVSGAMVSVCIKYAMYDRIFRLSHWSTTQILALYKCLEHYSGVHYYGSDLQRISDDPSPSDQLPARHPIHTMVNEKPDLTQEDYSEANEKFSVESLIFADQGETSRIQCVFADHGHRTEVLPAYIVMNLYGSLKAGIDLAGLATAESGGSA